MRKIIFALIFLLIALTGITCVCAVDLENSTLESSLCENDVGSISLGGIDNENDVVLSADGKPKPEPLVIVRHGPYIDPNSYMAFHMLIIGAKENSTVVLTNDYKGSNSYTVSSLRNIVVDGNGHTLDCSKSDCAVLGAVYSHITLKNLKIVNCKDSSLYVAGPGKLTIINCTFTGNRRDIGGAIRNDANSTLTIVDSMFKSNKAKHIGGAIFSQGAVNLINTKLVSNSAKQYGGAVFTNGNLNISDCQFMKNQATLSGGAVFGYKNIFVNQSRFESNKAMKKK